MKFEAMEKIEMCQQINKLIEEHSNGEASGLALRATITNLLFELFARKHTRTEYISSVLNLIQKLSGCRCVGIRILNKEGKIPYESYVGFSQEFWELENWISIKQDQCACIRVIKGKPEPQDVPLMTRAGSFRCNNLSAFVSKLTEKELSGFRGMCIKSGFESLSITPIFYRQKVIGAIHLADEKVGKVPFKMVESIESITPVIGEAIHRFAMKDKLKKQRDLLRELISKLRKEIIERKQVEDALLKNKAKFKAVFQSAAIGISIVDLEGRFLDSNPALQGMLACSDEELRGKSFTEFSHPEELDNNLALHNQLLAGKRDHFHLEKRYVRADGQVFWGHLTSSLVRENDGKPQFIIGMVEDINKRKVAEEALQEREEKFRKLFNNAKDPIFLCKLTEKGSPERFVEVNDAACQRLGYSRDELLEKDPLDIVAKANAVNIKKIIIDILAKGAITFEAALSSISGLIPVEVNASVFTMYEKRVLLLIARDITERKEAEKKVLAYQKKLGSLAAELSLAEERERRSIAMDLHDYIGQPLAISRIQLGALRSSMPFIALAEKIDEISALIGEAIRYTRSLTSEISPPVLYEIGFEPAIEWLGEQISKKHGIQFSYKDGRLPEPLCDEIRIILFKAVRELLFNIVKHARAQKARICVQNCGEKIRIKVEDDGIGFNASAGNTDKNDGFGLFSIRERLRYLGGQMIVESEPGRGTVVTLEAPLKGSSE